jgi:hypothetical protein
MPLSPKAFAVSIAHFFTKLPSLNGFFDLASSKAAV